MTMIELAIVTGIVSVLFALVLGLTRHVDATVKIRKAQAELGEWHEVLNRWFLQFGEYPHAQINTITGTIEPLFDSINWNFINPNHYPFVILTNDTNSGGCYVRFPHDTLPYTDITFRSFLTTSVNTIDPWGTPYIYIPSDNAKAYTLFSCGPNRQSHGIPPNAPATPDPSLDDIHFER